jgi:hypothetical protein
MIVRSSAQATVPTRGFYGGGRAPKSHPAPRARETKPAPATSTASEVWVNTRSGKYWKPGSRFYGKTKEDEFMSELEALNRGFSPAGGTGQ